MPLGACPRGDVGGAVPDCWGSPRHVAGGARNLEAEHGWLQELIALLAHEDERDPRRW
jgi:hypothetical protein